MTRLYWVSSVIVSTAIVATSVMTSMPPAEASLRLSSATSKDATVPVRPSDRTRVNPQLGQPDATQATAPIRSQNATLLATAGRAAGVGLAVAATLFGVGMYRLQQRSANHPVADKMLFIHPEMEHPELAITTLPKEALSHLTLDSEFEMSR